MLRLEFTDKNGTNWMQVNKTTAKKKFYEGKDVCLCASNLIPFGCWSNCNNGIVINISRYDGIFPKYEEVFNSYCNNFEYYNCINAETGKYIRFYIKGIVS